MKINTLAYQKKAYDLADRFRDIRFTGQVIFACLVLLISWSGVKTIQTNYELQKQISTLKQQNAVSKLQNSNLSLQNDYFKTDEYLELSARQNFGLGKPGETELLVSKTVAYDYAPAVNVQTAPIADTATGHTSNLQAWVNFFLHRPAQ
jgi:cell division protein FtsB